MRAPRPAIPTLTLLLMLAAGAAAAESWRPAPAALLTRWAAEVSPDQVLPEYPRPQLERTQWQNLNGLWRFSLGAQRPASADGYPRRILVPFPPESALSGIGVAMPLKDGPRAYWYRRTFSVPAAWLGQHVLLHFGAVSWQAEVLVNGGTVGTHTGGYDPFTYDVTAQLHGDGEQVLEVRVLDQVNGRAGGQPAKPCGKQRPHGSGIFYAASSGIWQTVWLEPVPATHITGLVLTPDLDAKSIHLMVHASAAATVAVTLQDDQGVPLATMQARSGQAHDLAFGEVPLRPWTPDTPYLYRVEATISADGRVVDRVRSYVGMRTIAIGLGKDGRTQRILLNHQELFQVGLLDQGYWPDGLYTAPTDAALRYDLEQTKAMGMNLVRKHIKVEPERFYYHCDRLGLLVWQDMPCLDGDFKEAAQTAAEKANYTDELLRMVDGLRNHPSIIMWVVFNEGWGQADTKRNVQAVLERDPSRLVDPASGWFDADLGHIKDNHAYPGPSYSPVAGRAAVCGECGGFGLPLKGHLWKGDANPYQAARDGEDLTRRMGGLLAAARNGWYGGLNALVYTQTTDVEEEVNGLITYDRAEVKPQVAELRAQVLATIAMPASADYSRGGTTIRLVLTPAQAARFATMRIAGSYNGWAAPQAMTAKGGGVFECIIANPLLTGAVSYRFYPGAGSEWAGAEGPDSFQRRFLATEREVVLEDVVFGQAK